MQNIAHILLNGIILIREVSKLNMHTFNQRETLHMKSVVLCWALIATNQNTSEKIQCDNIATINILIHILQITKTELGKHTHTHTH